jgi:4-amino-4-deoxy-L-arabinose transferase-like glycosyltransferase
MGSLMIPLGFIFARQLGFSRRAGLLLGLLLATSPYLVWYGQEAKMYTLLMVLVTLAFIAYLKALADAGLRWWLVFVITTSLSFYIHILSPLMLTVYGVVAFSYRVKLRSHWRAWLISMACLTLPYLPLILWHMSFLWSGAGRGHPFYPLHTELFTLLQFYSSGLFRFVKLTAVILFLFLFLCGLFLANQRMRAERITPAKRLLLAAWSLLPPLVVYLVSLRVPIFEDRYLIYITPAFYLMVALGIILVRQHAYWLASLCLGLILVINATGIWLQQREPIKADFRAAAGYIAFHAQPAPVVMVQMPYLSHTFDYYYPDEYYFIEGLWTNDGKSEAIVDAEMRRLTATVTELWLVVSEGETWDNRHMVRNWLDEHAYRVDEAHFTRVDVYRYQLEPGRIESQSLN